ncbi:hypothetical protein CLOSTMETH_03117 [[Clostridium] methylpentosum DSM 5476]|uniref:Uncharacterized protein n=1 Tax=[Clostridium] methylpentosum DSM 5476 TaxID=537013 RepID=C0EGX3_9FIRM|nr:hypothetical protein CLOSTMETH_03117 [[Clostridium] methylpentosum DSM 5476]
MNDVNSLSQSLLLGVYKLEWQERHRVYPKKSQKDIKRREIGESLRTL